MSDRTTLNRGSECIWSMDAKRPVDRRLSSQFHFVLPGINLPDNFDTKPTGNRREKRNELSGKIAVDTKTEGTERLGSDFLFSYFVRNADLTGTVNSQRRGVVRRVRRLHPAPPFAPFQEAVHVGYFAGLRSQQLKRIRCGALAIKHVAVQLGHPYHVDVLRR